MSHYPILCRVAFDKGSEFKRDFIPLLKEYDNKPVCTTVGKPQANGPIELVHKVMHNTIVTEDIKTRAFD